jgi:putative endonuclease
MDNYQVYLLTNPLNNCTYVGITNNLERRLKQHNGLLSGGAKYTTMNKCCGTWSVYGTIQNLTKSKALSLEKKIHIYSKKTQGSTPLQKRINCINNLLINYPHLFLTLL